MSEMEGREEPASGLLDFFDNNSEIALAVLIQNCLHPKNAQRVDAIKAETYVEIDSQETARNYLIELFKKNFATELKSAES